MDFGRVVTGFGTGLCFGALTSIGTTKPPPSFPSLRIPNFCLNNKSFCSFISRAPHIAEINHLKSQRRQDLLAPSFHQSHPLNPLHRTTADNSPLSPRQSAIGRLPFSVCCVLRAPGSSNGTGTYALAFCSPHDIDAIIIKQIQTHSINWSAGNTLGRRC